VSRWRGVTPKDRSASQSRTNQASVSASLSSPVGCIPRRPGSRTLQVHHLRNAACVIGSGLHCMQILAIFEAPKFGSEGRPACAAGRVQVPAPSARTRAADELRLVVPRLDVMGAADAGSSTRRGPTPLGPVRPGPLRMDRVRRRHRKLVGAFAALTVVFGEIDPLPKGSFPRNCRGSE
jgi:hypothetical protein